MIEVVVDVATSVASIDTTSFGGGAGDAFSMALTFSRTLVTSNEPPEVKELDRKDELIEVKVLRTGWMTIITHLFQI